MNEFSIHLPYIMNSYEKSIHCRGCFIKIRLLPSLKIPENSVSKKFPGIYLSMFKSPVALIVYKMPFQNLLINIDLLTFKELNFT